MTSTHNSFENVKDILISMGIKKSAITLDSDLKKDLGLDSLDLADLVFQIESNYNIRVSHSDTTQMNTIEDIANYLNTYQMKCVA